MASFSEEDGILRIPATSPCRDYQLRSSLTQLGEFDTSRPQSPWQPRSEVHSEEESAFRRYESSAAPLDRSKYYSGPQPVAHLGVARSYYSGPLPLPSPLPSYFSGAALPSFMTTTTESFSFRTGVRGYHSRQLVEPSSVSDRVPEVGSSRESSFREEEGASVADCADDVDEVGEVLYTSYLSKENGRRTPRSSSRLSPSPLNSVPPKPIGRMRNCVSGELGMRLELAQQRAQTARGYKSGEIFGLDTCADGIYPRSEIRKEAEEVKCTKALDARKHSPLESIAWETLNDPENESPNCDLDMVAIPFKWEDMPGKLRDSTKKAFSRSSSTSRPARITSERKVTSESQIGEANEKAESEPWSGSEAKPIAPAPAKLEKSPSVSSSKPKPEEVVSSAVPFKWELEPGKPKESEKATHSPDAAPALQLPPRLASTSSMKRNSWSASAPPSRRNSMAAAPATRARQPARSLTTPVSVGKHSLQSQEEPHSPSATPRHSIATPFRSDSSARPSDFTPKTTSSGPISQFGSPHYQSAEYLCEDLVSWNRVRSPTSILSGPDSNPSSCSDKSSRKSSVSFSNSGTSAESFEHWSYGDHNSPTSRHPSIREFPEPDGFSRACSVRDHEEADGTMTTLLRKLSSKASSSKPPMSPIQRSSYAAPAASSRSVDANGYSSHGEEYFDCQAPSPSPSPSPSCNPKDVELHSDTEEEAEVEPQPPTRLPYKMPSPVPDIEPDTVIAGSASPTRAVRDFTNCLGLPRFLFKGEAPCAWVANPSWDMPDAPTSGVEDGYRSPAYKATLELLSPSPNLMSKKNGRLSRTSSSRRRHPHLVEVLCNSLKQSLQSCTKRSVARTQSIVLYDDQFSKRHQSFMW